MPTRRSNCHQTPAGQMTCQPGPPSPVSHKPTGSIPTNCTNGDARFSARALSAGTSSALIPVTLTRRRELFILGLNREIIFPIDARHGTRRPLARLRANTQRIVSPLPDEVSSVASHHKVIGIHTASIDLIIVLAVAKRTTQFGQITAPLNQTHSRESKAPSSSRTIVGFYNCLHG